MRLGGRLAAAGEVLAEVLERRRPVAEALKDWGLSHRFAGSGDRAAIGAWRTVEEPLDLTAALRREATAGAVVLVDCLTLWVTNLMMAERDVAAESDRLADALAELKGAVLLVSNEVGLGIVPENAMARAFRDHAGRLHQQVAERADEVVLVAAGLPLKLK